MDPSITQVMEQCRQTWVVVHGDSNEGSGCRSADPRDIIIMTAFCATLFSPSCLTGQRPRLLFKWFLFLVIGISRVGACNKIYSGHDHLGHLHCVFASRGMGLLRPFYSAAPACLKISRKERGWQRATSSHIGTRAVTVPLAG